MKVERCASSQKHVKGDSLREAVDRGVGRPVTTDILLVEGAVGNAVP